MLIIFNFNLYFVLFCFVLIIFDLILFSLHSTLFNFSLVFHLCHFDLILILIFVSVYIIFFHFYFHIIYFSFSDTPPSIQKKLSEAVEKALENINEIPIEPGADGAIYGNDLPKFIEIGSLSREVMEELKVI